MFQTRRQNLISNIAKQNMQAVLINSPSNLYYYTGFTGGEAWFIIPVTKASDKKFDKLPDKSCNGYMITDSRYYEQVEKECPDLTLVRMENGGYSSYVRDLLNQMCLDGLLMTAESADDLLIAVESSLNLAQYLKLCEACPKYKFKLANDAIMQSRMVKDETELQMLTRAEAIGDAAFTHILDRIKPGITEKEIALELEFFMKRQGATKLSFDTIVASGSNSSMPHAQVTNRKIVNGDFVTMDFGCVYEGYCSDMTRTIAVGEPTAEMKKVYQIVLDANLRAMEGIKEGVRCNEIDAIARNHIKESGYGEYFGHGLGHGVGLDIHEEPRFSPKCDVITKENMVITDEPGIYLPGQFGVRIEDLVVVKKNGYQKLSMSSKELIVL